MYHSVRMLGITMTGPSLLRVVLTLLILLLSRSCALSNVRARMSRRSVLSWSAGITWVIPLLLSNQDQAVAVAEAPPTITIHLEKGESAGLELYDTLFNGRNLVTIKSVNGGKASSASVDPGMIVTDFQDAKAVAYRLKNGPYPVDLKIVNQISMPQDNFIIRTIRAGSSFGVQSCKGDLLEIVYEARIGSGNGPVYDSSAQRGTGLPYFCVLGSGDMIPGVDAGLNKMTPGEIRLLEIPSPLAYGNRGSKLFQIPANTKVVWTIQMVSVNGEKEGQDN